ncbi:MAG: TonB-dependent receptor [Pirellulales bacterium]
MPLALGHEADGADGAVAGEVLSTMFSQSLISFGLVVSLFAGVTFAQQPGSDEPTQPEIEVTPPAGSQPEIVVQPPVVPVEQSYPGPSQQVVGDGPNTGVLRSRNSVQDSERAVSRVTRDDLERKQAATPFEALQNEVGVLMQSTAAGQASPFVRGLTGQQVLLLIDGIRMNNSVYRFGPNQYFNTVDIGMIDHIDVMRGAGSVLWGSDAIGGVINVVSRGADSEYGMRCGNFFGQEFSEYYNTANSSSYSRLNVEGWFDNAGFFAGGSFMNPHDLDTGWFFGRQRGTNYQQFAGDIKFNFLLDASQMVTVAFQHFEQEDLPRSDRFPGFPGDINGSNNAGNARFFDPQQRDLVYIRYQALNAIPLFDAVTFTASYHRQRDIQTRGIPTVRFQETDVETAGLNLVASRDLHWLGKITLGADWYHDDIDSPFGGTASGSIIPDDAYYRRIGAFLNWEVPITTTLAATAGVRFEQIDAAGTPIIDVVGVPTPVPALPHYQDWVAHAGLVYHVTPDVNLVASFSEGFRAPNLDELMGNNPNVLQQGQDLPSLGLFPEHSYNYELGVKADYDHVRAQAFVFWNDLQDNIVPIAAGANQFRRDNQDSIINGVEFNGEYLFDCGWSVYGNYWYIYGRNEITRAPLSRIPPTQGTVGLRWRDSKLRSYLDIYTWLVSRQNRLDPVRDVGDERIPPGGTPGYATLNMRLGRSFGDRDQHRFSLGLENITDEPYLVHGSGVFGTGFTSRLGYSWWR